MAKLDFSNDSIFKTPPAEVAVHELVPQKFETKDLLAKFAQHETRIKAMSRQVMDLVIKTEEDNIAATAMGTNAAAAVKELNALRDRIIRPYKVFVDAIRGGCKKYTNMVETEIISILKLKQKGYNQEQRIEAEKKRLEHEKQQKEQRDKLKAKIAKIEKDSGVKLDIPAIPDTPPPPVGRPGPVRTSQGTSYSKDKTIVEIEDVALIPREYLMPDMPKIRAACKAGKKIPGVKSYEDEDIIYRTA